MAVSIPPFFTGIPLNSVASYQVRKKEVKGRTQLVRMNVNRRRRQRGDVEVGRAPIRPPERRRRQTRTVGSGQSLGGHVGAGNRVPDASYPTVDNEFTSTDLWPCSLTFASVSSEPIIKLLIEICESLL